jgi:hypothetical protein
LVRNAGSEKGHVRILLGAFLLGGLSAGEERAVRSHLDACAECRAEYEYLACVPQWLDLVRGESGDAAGSESGESSHSSPGD